MMFIVVGTMVVGQILLMVSTLTGRYSMALCARILLGMGLECQNVVIYAFIALWFSGKEHGLACAGLAMMMRLGMVSTDFITPIVDQIRNKLVDPFGIALGISGLVVCAATLMVWIDCKNQKAVRKILKRADTLEAKYAKKHEHDLDLFRNDSGFEQKA